MKKAFRIILIFLIVIFIIAQFFQPEKNNSEKSTSHILKVENVPGKMEVLLTNACLDCHSNQTNYLWYHRVSPVSWLINNHIMEGKENMNLSEWGELDVFDKIGTLEEMYEEVENGEMPLNEYVLLHPKAKISENDMDLFRKWTESLSEELISEMDN